VVLFGSDLGDFVFEILCV